LVCILYAICKWKESKETSKLKKVLNFIKNVIFCPIELLIKVFKKKEETPATVEAPKKKRKK